MTSRGPPSRAGGGAGAGDAAPSPLQVRTLLAGVAIRPLAQSARRSGRDAASVDHFGDRDHRRSLPVLSLRDAGRRDYSAEGLVRLAERVRAREVAYGADLENHPDLVARLASGRRLLGNPPEVLRRVRDPRLLAASLGDAGFPAPSTTGPGEAPPSGGRTPAWLRKPVRGGGGQGVRPWRPGDPVGDDRYVQERIRGTPVSVLFLSDGRAARVLAVTEMLVGRASLGGHGFTYCGSLLRLSPGGIALPPGPAGGGFPLAEARAVAGHLARAFGLRGLNGLDAVLSGGRIWPVEVNPRWTAAMELLEPGPAPADGGETGTLFGAHRRACRGRLPPTGGSPGAAAGGRWRSLLRGGPPPGDVDPRPGRGRSSPSLVVGKAVLRARHDARAPELDERPRGAVLVDVPEPGEAVPAGGPVCSLLAAGEDRDGCLGRLEAAAAGILRRLRPPDG